MADRSSAWLDDAGIPKPPVPLILAGAAFSTADAIRGRWRETLTWARQYGFHDLLIAELPAPPDEDVAERIAGVSADGKGWWPVWGEQIHPPKPTPTKEALVEAMSNLKRDWNAIAGDELSRITRPIDFAGRKSRRLIVSADPAKRPPWGSWYWIEDNPRAFTAFRRAVNDAISPLEVDDITFNTNGWEVLHT